MKAYKHILDGTELDLAPAGWDDIGINYIRNEFYHGISRSFILTLRFPMKAGGGGLDILSAYETDGINAVMTYEVQERNGQTDDYDTIFTGILDFTPDRWSIDYKMDFFEIGAIDGSKEQKFFTRDEVVFDLNSLVSADGDTMTEHVSSLDVTFNPVNIYLSSSLAVSYSDSFTLTQSNLVEVPTPTVAITTNEMGARIDEDGRFYNNTTAFDQEVTVRLFGTYQITYGNDPDLFQKSTLAVLNVTSYNDSGVKVLESTYQWNTLTESASPISGSVDNTTTFTVPSNGYLELTYTFTRSGSSTFPAPQPDNAVTVEVSFSTFDIFEQSSGQEATDIPCYSFKDAMIRLIQLATSEDTLANTLNNSNIVKMEYLMLTTGWNLRQYPGKPFNISIRELFKTGDAMLFLGLYYDRANDYFKIDYKQNLYDESNQMFDLGEVADFKTSPAKEHYFNEVIFGYNEEVEYEELQGANEFNVPCQHYVNVPVKKKLEIKTEINGDTIGAELARRLPYRLYAQQDSRYDEQRFIFEKHNELDYILQGVLVTDGFEGSDEYYNTRYTPRENLKRWKKYLIVPLFRSDLETKFIKTQKNVFIEISNDSELTGLSATDLAVDPLFHPEIYEFKAPLSKSNIETLNTDPHGVITFTFRNTEYAGFILEVKGNGYKKDASWKLLKAPNLDKSYLFEDGNNYIFEDADDYEFE